MIRRPPRSTQSRSSAASDVYKRQALFLITILLTHELGHFFVSRRYGVEVTLPFFIPFPLSPFGTLGAVIKMKGIMPNRKALFDIGIDGPFVGLVLTIPTIIIGL